MLSAILASRVLRDKVKEAIRSPQTGKKYRADGLPKK
jgi:hypothetical protein